MVNKIAGAVRAALRKRSTYLCLMLVVLLLVMIPVIREDGPGSLALKGGAVPELLALIYALQRLKPGDTLPEAIAQGLEKGEPVGQAEWAQAAGEQDMTVWRTGARRALQSHPVVVFSKTYCPYSRRAKELLATYKLEPPPLVFELDVREDGRLIQETLRRLTGRSTVPNVIVGPAGESIGGADDVAAMHDAGRLRPVLERAARAARAQ